MRSLASVVLLASLSSSALASEAPSAIWRLGMPAWIVAMSVANPLEADALTVGLGGSDDIVSTQIMLRWDQDKKYQMTDSIWFEGYRQAGYTIWQIAGESLEHDTSNHTLDVMQGFRWYFADKEDWLSYANVALGVSLISNDELDGKKFGGPFQFTEFVGIGGYVTPQWQWDFGVRHYSNNDIYEENSGINFYRLNISYNY